MYTRITYYMTYQMKRQTNLAYVY